MLLGVFSPLLSGVSQLAPPCLQVSILILRNQRLHVPGDITTREQILRTIRPSHAKPTHSPAGNTTCLPHHLPPFCQLPFAHRPSTTLPRPFLFMFTPPAGRHHISHFLDAHSHHRRHRCRRLRLSRAPLTALMCSNTCCMPIHVYHHHSIYPVY